MELDKKLVSEFMNLSLDEIHNKISKIDDEIEVFWNDNSLSWDGYLDATKALRKERTELTAAKTMILPMDHITLEDCLDWELKDCKVPIEDFIKWCETGYVTSYDGNGVYATADNKRTTLGANPIHIRNGYVRKDFPFVIWYNK